MNERLVADKAKRIGEVFVEQMVDGEWQAINYNDVCCFGYDMLRVYGAVDRFVIRRAAVSAGYADRSLYFIAQPLED